MILIKLTHQKSKQTPVFYFYNRLNRTYAYEVCFTENVYTTWNIVNAKI